MGHGLTAALAEPSAPPAKLGGHWPTAAELETEAQRRNFALMVAGTLVAAGTFGIGFALQGQWREVLVDALIVAVCLACGLWKRCTRQVRGPMTMLSMTVVGLLAWQMITQGPQLPAAAAWMAVMPFILAGAGLHAMAIAAVAFHLGIVGVLLFLPEVTPLGGVSIEISAPRRFAAEVGSQSLAIWLVVAAMLGRRRTQSAIDAAREAAVDALAVRSRFLANMSHEVRTPLNGIVATAELLRSPTLDPAQRHRLLEMQHHSAQQLLALVNDVLDWSKLEVGKTAIEKRPVSLRRLVFEVNERFAMQAHHKGIELTSSCNADVPAHVLADETRLRQIVDNLVGNAVKFTAEGGVHIHLSVDSQAKLCEQPVPRWVRIEVSDSGIGIEPKRLRQLFEAFTQADDSVTRRFGGTGLGLAISRELARLMGGRIDVTSAPRQGSTFTLVVPLAAVGCESWKTPLATSEPVIVASASAGVQRHLRSILNDLGIEPQQVGELPPAGAARDGRVVLVDAPILGSQANASNWLARQMEAGRHVVLVMPLGTEAPAWLPANVQLLHKPVRRRALRSLLEQLCRQDPDSPSVAVTDAEPSDLGPLHVLVAEDNHVNQIVAQEMLKRLGARCTIVGDGRAALQRLEEERFDLVLMDLQMPELDGVNATRALRAAEVQRGVPHVPVIAMTAHSHPDEFAAWREAGMDDWITKPYRLADLHRVLSSWARTQPDDRRSETTDDTAREAAAFD